MKYAPLTSGYNRLVGGSSPLGPTTQSYATGDFLKEYEKPRIGGIRGTVRSQRRHRYSRQVVSAHFSLAPKSRFPETETARGRDSVRMPVTPQEVRADWRNASPFLAILVKPITALIIISRVGKMRCEEQGYEPTIRPTHRLCHSECNNRLGACRSLR